MMINDEARKLIDSLAQLGFTPETHPNILKDMRRALKEAGAREGVDMETPLSWRFHFADDGSVTVEILKDGPDGVLLERGR
jgi:hypothetical protein